MDLGGKDTGRDVAFAPCDLRVVRVRPNANGEVYVESTSKVELRDGTKDYVHFLLMHTENFNYKVGRRIKQFTPFYTEGGMGRGRRGYFGSHIHIEGGKGKWRSPYQYQNKYGTYISENMDHLYNLFFVDDTKTKVLNDAGHKWVHTSNTNGLTKFTVEASKGDIKKFESLADSLQIKYIEE